MAMVENRGRLGGLGGSLKVDNVQALATAAAADDPKYILTRDRILNRYIRPETDVDDLVRVDDDRIPVVDLQRLVDPNSSQEEADKLKSACEDWGFFQLVNHGVSEELMERVKADVEGFFRLPLEAKEECAQLPGGLEGYGQAFVVSEEQKLDWGDMLFLLSQPQSCKAPKFWPTDPPTFRQAETLDKYSLEVRRVAHCILGFMSRNLGLESDRLIDSFKEFQSFRINYYPPCPYAKNVLGIAPHSDAVGLTILLQVNSVEGLQISRNGRWIPVKPLPGAFVANIGDILEMLTNGKYKSIEHRVIVDLSKERLSIAAFHTASMGSVVGPLPELVDGSKEYYKSLSMEDFTKLVVSSKLDGKGLMDRLKLNP
ncbi:S-norcoclaurine synthase 1-like [Iris pallida]|uniref:S-norcoclaurine synthase 1-like n=1 Tax=Iris pallida TaxID=29817 RepID=A0AAX6EWL7_IRIPA|nr:S-norcoclaurine synthase 1-like [Iris pallida]